MRLFHLSDLHIGKRVNEFSMIEDQKYILERILDLAEKEMPDGVILAGDIYDKQIPSAEDVYKRQGIHVSPQESSFYPGQWRDKYSSPCQPDISHRYMQTGPLHVPENPFEADIQALLHNHPAVSYTHLDVYKRQKYIRQGCISIIRRKSRKSIVFYDQGPSLCGWLQENCGITFS